MGALEDFEPGELNQTEQAYVARWAPEVAADWRERFGAKTFGKLGTALYLVAKNKEAQSKVSTASERNIEDTA